MDFINYRILFKNYELADCEVQLQDLSTLEDPPGDTVVIDLDGAESPALIDTPALDDDKTKSIRGKRFRASFLSGDDYDIDGSPGTVDVRNFSDGQEGRFLTRISCDTLALPFLGNIILDDNFEAFQPKANAVILSASCGLGTLRDVELTESDGDIPLGHYRIIDYITLCLRNLAPSQDIHVVFNKYEEDTDPDVTHTFFDIFLHSLTFETEVDGRDNCYTVLEKILDAFGCFITYDQDGWWIINWDEYDSIAGGITTLRTGHFNSEGNFSGYTDVSVDKFITHDGDPLYEGHRLSNDNATRRFQRKAGKVKHTYKFEQPKELPCNASFTRGTVDDDVLPLKTFDPDCWTLKKGPYTASGSPTNEMKIGVRYDVNDIEEERFLYLTPVASAATDSFTYAESQPIEVQEKDKFEFSYNWRTESVFPGAYGGLTRFAILWLHGIDGSDWLLGHNTLGDPTTPLKWWDTTNFTVNTSAGRLNLDTTLIEEQEWQSVDLGESPETPVDGKLYIWLFQLNQSAAEPEDDNIAIDYADLRFTYIPYINGTYHRIEGQEEEITGDDDSRRTIEKQMFISDSPKPLFKGAMKKFDGTDYVLTGVWFDYLHPDGSYSGKGNRLATYILFQYWNQYRKTRTVIETDLQGLRSTTEFGIPGLIHRWQIVMGGEENKYFMLTSIPEINFRNCGWRGVFVEMSDADGDRNYDDYPDNWNFKYIQG